jgi:hypothetical protein
MRGWERGWTSNNWAHPGMVRSACTGRQRLSRSEKLGYEWRVSYSEAMRWLTINRDYAQNPSMSEIAWFRNPQHD